MSILFWALPGLVIALFAGFVVKGYGILEDIIVGVVGAVIGGWLAVLLIGAPLADLHPASVPAATVGAFLFIILSRRITRGRTAI